MNPTGEGNTASQGQICRPWKSRVTHDIDIACPELPERAFQRDVYVLRAIAPIVRLDSRASLFLFLCNLHTSKFRRDNHLVSNTSLLHPLADPLFTFSELIVHSSVDPVPALLVEVVQDLEGCLFRALAEGFFPRITKVHAAQCEGRDTNCGCGAEDAVSAKQRHGLGGVDERHCGD